MPKFRWFWCIVILESALLVSAEDPEAEAGVKYADECEVCKILALELESRLAETGRTSAVIEVGYGDVKKRIPYRDSEQRLVDSLDGLCERVLEYNLHKERDDSTRFAKGMSQTFRTLHGLVDKGVKVDLGIPPELWDKPPVEVTNMKSQCESLLEHHEEDIEDWYWKHQNDTPLKKYLCVERALKNKNVQCLDESLKGEKGAKKKKSEL